MSDLPGYRFWCNKLASSRVPIPYQYLNPNFSSSSENSAQNSLSASYYSNDEAYLLCTPAYVCGQFKYKWDFSSQAQRFPLKTKSFLW